MRTIKVGSRKSQLALTQTKLVLAMLQEKRPDLSFELISYQTKGDRLAHVSLQKIGGKGVFVKDLEQALLAKEVDLLVHSFKDMPAKIAPATVIAAIPEREDVRDCLIFSEQNMTLAQLPAGARVGTSSLRRQLQLQALRPDLDYQPIRGNLDTRLAKLRQGEYDAIVLALAGIRRLGWEETLADVMEILPLDQCLPAVAQAALAVQCREEEQELQAMLRTINQANLMLALAIEREFLALMKADCSFPIAALVEEENGGYRLRVMLANASGHCFYATVFGFKEEVHLLASSAMAILASQGLEELPWQKP